MTRDKRREEKVDDLRLRFSEMESGSSNMAFIFVLTRRRLFFCCPVNSILGGRMETKYVFAGVQKPVVGEEDGRGYTK